MRSDVGALTGRRLGWAPGQLGQELGPDLI